MFHLWLMGVPVAIGQKPTLTNEAAYGEFGVTSAQFFKEYHP
jgi:hypothetical protein